MFRNCFLNLEWLERKWSVQETLHCQAFISSLREMSSHLDKASFSDGYTLYGCHVNMTLQYGSVQPVEDEIGTVNPRDQRKCFIEEISYDIVATTNEPDRAMILAFPPSPTPNPTYPWKNDKHAGMSMVLSSSSTCSCTNLCGENAMSWMFHQAIQDPLAPPNLTCDEVESYCCCCCCSIAPETLQHTFANDSLVLCHGRLVVKDLPYVLGTDDTIESDSRPVLFPCFSCIIGRQDQQPTMYYSILMDQRFLYQQEFQRAWRFLLPTPFWLVAIIILGVLGVILVVVVMWWWWWRRFQRHRLYQQLHPDNHHDLLLTVEDDDDDDDDCAYSPSTATLPRSTFPMLSMKPDRE